ncbi:hypothetical protein M0R45_015579 [Rubus argutus]|uniref:Disease resistance N-terminal domain-containing protein n=1 Tax=Rubus argutus TaxID=59490 RepID=A0AAW1XSF1_RUBAR
MALEVVGGAFLEEVFDKMYSREVKDFIQGKKFTEVLLKNVLKITLLSVNAVLDDAEEKQISNSDVKQWLGELKEAIYDAEDLLNEIKIEALSCKVEAEFGSRKRKFQESLIEVARALTDASDLIEFLIHQGAPKVVSCAYHRLCYYLPKHIHRAAVTCGRPEANPGQPDSSVLFGMI